MEFSIKNILITISALFFAFTLYWFIQFGTVFWFLSIASEEINKISIKQTQQMQINNERIKSQRALSELKIKQNKLKLEEERKKQIFIASGDHSKKISEKEKRCNDAILKAMADKSKEARERKIALCKGI